MPALHYLLHYIWLWPSTHGTFVDKSVLYAHLTSCVWHAVAPVPCDVQFDKQPIFFASDVPLLGKVVGSLALAVYKLGC